MPLFLSSCHSLNLIKLGLIELHALQFGDDAEQLRPWLEVMEFPIV